MWRTATGGVTAATMVLLLASCGSDAPAGSAATTTSSVPPTAATAAPTTVPPTTTTLAEYYEIEAGDSLSGIAKKFDVRIEDLISINEITNPDHIQVGDTLRIPPPTILLNDVSTSSSIAPSP